MVDSKDDSENTDTGRWKSLVDRDTATHKHTYHINKHIHVPGGEVVDIRTCRNTLNVETTFPSWA